jgi:octaprenyl-diphosphate synthase
LIYSIENASRTGRNRIKSLVRKKKKSVKILKEINDIIYDAGGFDYAKKKLDEFSDKATDSISSYVESEIKKSLVNLVIFNKERVR